MKGHVKNPYAGLRNILIHILVWILYIFYETSILLYIEAGNIFWWEILSAFALNVAIFYITADYILPKCVGGKMYLLIPACLIALVIIYLFASYLETRYLFPFIEGKDALQAPILTKIYKAQHIYRATYFIGLSFGYWFAKKSIKSEKRLRESEKEQYLQTLSQQELKREIAVSKLAFYRSQLNPHFLFNTLNFFYSNIYTYSKELAESMVLLSNLMRYITQKSSEEDLVPLNGEIELIENYFKLNQLRFENALQIKFEVKGIPDHKKIAPFIMMTLIENAFKYGDVMDEKRPLIIKINVLASRIEFYIENKISVFDKPAGTGTGLQNLKKQLDLIYADNYSLTTEERNNQFACRLKINNLVC